MTVETRLVQVRTQVLKQNDVVARELRTQFHEAGVCVVSLVSSPGSGKTKLLEETLSTLGASHQVAALVGDLATENDARRLSETGVPVRQITTGTVCTLEAELVRQALAGWDLETLDFLFIENVGNLVCPATYDLGEDLRVVLFSVTEGEDKPQKYPTVFNTADLALLTKLDLAEAVEFDRAAAYRSVESVRPGMPVLEVSAKSGVGMEQWVGRLRDRRRQLFPGQAVTRSEEKPATEAGTSASG